MTLRDDEIEEPEHELSINCWCEPKIIDGVIVHNSFDGREDFEDIEEVQ
jgi:hypothetical protein